MFSGCTVPLNSKDTEFGTTEQEASSLSNIEIGVVLVPCPVWKHVPTVNCIGVDIPEVSLYHL